LKHLLLIQQKQLPKLQEVSNEILKLFPNDVLQYYSPDYESTLPKKIEDYKMD
jgi:hypothetical protein